MIDAWRRAQRRRSAILAVFVLLLVAGTASFAAVPPSPSRVMSALGVGDDPVKVHEGPREPVITPTPTDGPVGHADPAGGDATPAGYRPPYLRPSSTPTPWAPESSDPAGPGGAPSEASPTPSGTAGPGPHSPRPKPSPNPDPSDPPTNEPTPATYEERYAICSDEVARQYPEATPEASQQASAQCADSLEGDTPEEARANAPGVVAPMGERIPGLEPEPEPSPSPSPSSSPSSSTSSSPSSSPSS